MIGFQFPWKWQLSDGFPAKGIDYHGSKVFSCFACGGGSSMGYKLVGYDVLGGLDIDSRTCKLYEKNLSPKFLFNEDIRKFRKRKNLPKELFDLDILDGSPPCTSFSHAGNREKSWGKEKKYNEGSVSQILDDLFVEYIFLAKKLQPRFIIAENVPGLNIGVAKKYMSLIGNSFKDAGYLLTWKLLNSDRMGVPQSRKRLFFLGVRKDFGKEINMKGFFSEPNIDLVFNMKEISFREISDDSDKSELDKKLKTSQWWESVNQGELLTKSFLAKGRGFDARRRLSMGLPCKTVTSASDKLHATIRRYINKQEVLSASTFPSDYAFMKVPWLYVMGESVPPVMMAQVSLEVYRQWISKVKK